VLISDIGRTLSAIKDEDIKGSAKEWVASSYVYTEDILEAISKAPSPTPALVCDIASELTRADLLEIGRCTDPEVLEKVSQLLSHLQVVNHVPNCLYLPLSLTDDEIFSYLPHVLFPGSLFSRRLSVFLAILAVKQGNIHIGEQAKRFIIDSRGNG
jgi:hypothetical protein